MILFAAIDVPEKVAKDLSRMQKGVAGARWRTTEQMHITLGYFGEIDDDAAENLDAELAGKAFPAFELTVRSGGHFGHNEPHAIWAGLDESEALNTLNAHCRNSARRAGITMEKRVFRPHITMAYLNNSPPERVIAFEKNMLRFKSGPFLVDQFALYSSHPKKRGSNLYRVEATYPLLAGPILGGQASSGGI